MTCKDVAEFLTDYLDHTLSWHKRLTFQFHLLLCRDCRRYLDSCQKTPHVIQSLHTAPLSPAEDEVPEALVQAILASRGRDSEPDAG